MPQDAWIQKTAINSELLALYYRALEARRENDPDLTFSAWQRAALSKQAAKDLGVTLEELAAKAKRARPKR